MREAGSNTPWPESQILLCAPLSIITFIMAALFVHVAVHGWLTLLVRSLAMARDNEHGNSSLLLVPHYHYGRDFTFVLHSMGYVSGG